MSIPEFDKPDMKTDDLTALNVERIGKLFPQVIVEKKGENGEIEKGIDFDALRTILSGAIVDDERERYRLDWPGKKASLVKANTPITDTLRPDRAESVDWEHTENVFIEGDNFKALKILQESYLGQVKMIYIDPPYNTGKDFVYSDKFTMDKDEYEEAIGQHDEEDNKLFKENTKTNPRYHSDWLSMMYERLVIARDLLRDDGVIFISIDDNEVHNLRMICNEIFGEENFVEHFVWKSGRTSSSIYTREHEYVIAFCKNKEKLELLEFNGNEKISDRAIKKITKKNPATEICFSAGSVRFEGRDQVFPKEFGGSEKIKVTDGSLEFKNGTLVKDVCLEAGWAMKDMIESWLAGDSNIIDSKGQQVEEFFFKENGVLQYVKNKGTIHPRTIITEATTKKGTNELKDLLDFSPFDYPKATDLIRFFLTHTKEDDIILDFFAGSSTTAHAIMAHNAEDGRNRRYIMVQLDEKTDEKSEAYKAGYKTIAELARERVRRAAKKIKEDYADKLAERETPLDTGFRAYRVDSTNMKDVYYHPKDLKQGELLDLVDHVKADRSPEDLLTQLMLDLGLTLDLPMESIERGEQTIYTVGGNSLVACLDTKITMDIVDEIAGMQPLRAVFRDSAFVSEDDRINLDTHFKRHSPDTKITVI